MRVKETEITAVMCAVWLRKDFIFKLKNKPILKTVAPAYLRVCTTAVAVHIHPVIVSAADVPIRRWARLPAATRGPPTSSRTTHKPSLCTVYSPTSPVRIHTTIYTESAASRCIYYAPRNGSLDMHATSCDVESSDDTAMWKIPFPSRCVRQMVGVLSGMHRYNGRGVPSPHIAIFYTPRCRVPSAEIRCIRIVWFNCPVDPNAFTDRSCDNRQLHGWVYALNLT